MKWERMLAGARALEKGLQMIEQDSIEEMALRLSSLVDTGRGGLRWVVMMRRDSNMRSIQHRPDPPTGLYVFAPSLMCTKYSLLQKIDLGQDTIRTIHRTGTLWNIPEAGLFRKSSCARTQRYLVHVYASISTSGNSDDSKCISMYGFNHLS